MDTTIYLNAVQTLRMEQVINYVDRALDQEIKFTAPNFRVRLQLLKNDDFRKLIKIIDQKAKAIIKSIEIANELKKQEENLQEYRVMESLYMSGVQTFALRSIIKNLIISPHSALIQATACIAFGIMSANYSYNNGRVVAVMKCMDLKAKNIADNVQKIQGRMVEVIYENHTDYLEQSMEQIRLSALDVKRDTRDIKRYFNTLIRAMQANGVSQEMLAIAPPPPNSITSDEYEHVSQSSHSDEPIMAAHGHLANPDNIAADYHIEFAENEIGRSESSATREQEVE